MSTLTDFRAAYSFFLVAAQRLRSELDPAKLDKTTPADIHRIQILVSAHFGIPMPRLLSRCRDDDTSRARHVAMALCVELTRHTKVTISQAFRRDHGTVIHGLRSLYERCEQDREFAAVVEQLRTAASTDTAAV